MALIVALTLVLLCAARPGHSRRSSAASTQPSMVAAASVAGAGAAAGSGASGGEATEDKNDGKTVSRFTPLTLLCCLLFICSRSFCQANYGLSFSSVVLQRPTILRWWLACSSTWFTAFILSECLSVSCFAGNFVIVVALLSSAICGANCRGFVSVFFLFVLLLLYFEVITL